jgi:hypothetical protein
MKVAFLNAAWGEFLAAVAYYDAQRPGLGDEFAAAVWNGVDHIRDFPNAWQSLGRGYRRYRLKRFPYGLVYKVGKEQTNIFAVMHLRRRPGYWRGRETQ